MRIGWHVRPGGRLDAARRAIRLGHHALVRIADFELERFFARWEFAVPYLLCASDVEGWPMAELLGLADDESRSLWENLKLSYTETLGHPLLRAEIAGLHETLTGDDVLVFSGPSEAIFATVNVTLRPGDHAACVWPAYQSLHEVARAVGADVSLIRLREDEGWRLDPDAVRRALTPRTRLVVLNAPHNPTGMIPDLATYRAIVEMTAEAGATLLSDEVYRFLEHDPADGLPAGADAGPHVATVGGLSKSFGLPGLRIGWLATRDRRLLDAAARFKDYTTLCPPGPSEILALIALRARELVLARSRAIVTVNLGRVDRFLTEFDDLFSWVRPRGSSVGFVRLRADPAEMDVERFVGQLVESEGVLLAPGHLFGDPDGRHVRIGYGRQNLPDALERLERFATRALR